MMFKEISCNVPSIAIRLELAFDLCDEDLMLAVADLDRGASGYELARDRFSESSRSFKLGRESFRLLGATFSFVTRRVPVAREPAEAADAPDTLRPALC